MSTGVSTGAKRGGFGFCQSLQDRWVTRRVRIQLGTRTPLIELYIYSASIGVMIMQNRLRAALPEAFLVGLPPTREIAYAGISHIASLS